MTNARQNKVEIKMDRKFVDSVDKDVFIFFCLIRNVEIIENNNSLR
jgi:hypothetical protein